MRTALLGLFLVATGCDRPPAGPATTARVAPQHPMMLRYFLGGVDSGQSASSQTNWPPSLAASVVVKAGVKYGPTGGPFAEVGSEFLGRRSEMDVYRLVSTYPVGDSETRTRTDEVAFAGKRVVVFEDGEHSVVLDPAPKPVASGPPHVPTTGVSTSPPSRRTR